VLLDGAVPVSLAVEVVAVHFIDLDDARGRQPRSHRDLHRRRVEALFVQRVELLGRGLLVVS